MAPTYLHGHRVEKLTLADSITLSSSFRRRAGKKRSKFDIWKFFFKWTPQECYYYVVEKTGFQANPFRTKGTYSKYNSLDDKLDGFHYYTSFIKFGLGRTSYEASQEIRNKHLTREEGLALVRRFDGEFPEKYFSEIMDYIEMKPDQFFKLCDQFRSPHLWKKENGEWKLRHQVC